MASFTGTDADETIAPGIVSSTVASNPAGSSPSAAADFIEGGNGADVLRGGGGNDTLYGRSTSISNDGVSDFISGDGGSDTIWLSTGADRAYGGDDDDALVVGYQVQTGAAILNGGAGTDTLSVAGDITGATLRFIERLELSGASSTRMTADQLGSGGQLAGYGGASIAGVTLTGGGTALDLATDPTLTGLTIYGSSTAQSVGLAASSQTALSYHGGGDKDQVIGGAAADFIEGGNGADVLRGGGGGDTLEGGAAADRFVFRSLSDFGRGTTRDWISDFNRNQGDRIDVSAIDANGRAAGNQAFSFLGTAAFTGHAGELHYASTGNGMLVVSGDVDGNRSADFQFNVTAADLASGDFKL